MKAPALFSSRRLAVLMLLVAVEEIRAAVPVPLSARLPQLAPARMPGIAAGKRSGGKRIAISSTNPARQVATGRLGPRGLSVAPVNAFGFLPAAQVHAPVRAALVATGVVLDQTLGQTQQPVITTNADGRNDYGLQGTMGKQVGGNLFFSFSTFGLATKESATFSGATDVQNILARVTGGAVSSIDGTLRSQIPEANLYLINPAGVVFGANAQLDVSGLFVVSTADYLKLADGARFSVPSGSDDAGLSAASVAAFGFLHPAPAPVTFNGAQLTVPAGAGLHVIAGDVALDGASLRAPSGDLTIFSAASTGEVPFDLASPGSAFSAASNDVLGQVSFANGAVASISGAGAEVSLSEAGV